MYINISVCLILLLTRHISNHCKKMDLSGNTYSTNANYELQTCRLRLISDIMHDYQYNVRESLRLISVDMRGEDPPPTRQNEQPHLRSNNIQPISTPPQTNSNRHQPTRNSNMGYRRGYIYSQYIEPHINRQLTNDEVEEGLDNEQIENNTQSVQYSESMNDMRCPITWDQFDASHSLLSINRCGHIFGETALRSWLQTHRRCPVCRTNVVENTATTRGESTNNSINNNALSNLIYSTFSAPENINNEYYENEITFNSLTDFYSALLNSQNYQHHE
jgi:hypothetical protein